MGLCFDSEIFMVYTGHTGEYFCKISWQLDVFGQPICILQMEQTLLKWAVNNICYTWLWGFNSKVRVNVLSYNFIYLSFGMSRSYINFCNSFWGLVLKGGVLNHATVVFMKLFCSTCCMMNVFCVCGNLIEVGLGIPWF